MDISNYIKNNSLEIIVKPNSSKSEIKEYDENRKALRVNIKAQPENNKANIEIIKFFTKLTGKEVKIISGHTSKRKILKFS